MKIALPFITLFILQSVQAETPLDDLFAMSFEELTRVEITGSTLTEENIHLVPSAVTVFTHDEIKLMGFDYLDELVKIVPGFQSHRSAQSALQNPISSRGRLVSLEASEILVMVDGQRIDGPRSNGITVPFPKYSLNFIQRVEFIRGPGSAIHGSNAMMGVINIVTRKDVNELEINYGSFNRRMLNLQASTKIKDFELNLFAQTDMDDGEDYKLKDTFSTDDIDTDDPRKLDDITIKISWFDTHIDLQHHQFETDNFYELDGISDGFNQRKGSLTSASIKQDFRWFEIDSWIQLNHKETNIHLSGQLTPEGGLAAISNPSSNDALFVDAKFHNYSESHLQWHNNLEITENSSLQLGLVYRYIESPQTIGKNNFDLADLATQNFPIRYYGSMLATTSVQGSSQRDVWSQYAQLQHHFESNTHLTLGLRYDDFDELGSQLSPRIGLVQELNPQQSIKLLYGEAFRAPSESELHLNNNPVLLGNPNLEAEKVQNWDLIWVGQWQDTAFSIGYFESHFTDAIVEAPSDQGTPQFDNQKQDPSKGFEFELSSQMHHNWLIRGSYTHINEKPDLSYREASELASININYHQSDWNANVIATWHGEREMATLKTNGERKKLSSNWLLWGKLTYRINSDWHSFLQIKNISDKKDSSPTLGASLTEGVDSRGREFLAGVRWTF